MYTGHSQPLVIYVLEPSSYQHVRSQLVLLLNIKQKLTFLVQLKTVLAEDIEMSRKVSWNWQLSSKFMSYLNESKLSDRKVYIHVYPDQTAQRSKSRKAHSDQSLHYLSHLMTQATKWFVRPAKTLINLGIHAVWSVFAMRSIGS